IWQQPTPSTQTSGAGTPFSGLNRITIDAATNTYYVDDLGTNPHVGVHDDSVYIGSLTGTAAQRTPSLFLSLGTADPQPGAQGLTLDNAPTLAVTNAAPTFTEKGASVPLISGSTADAADQALAASPTNPILASATVSISTGFFTGDLLSVNLGTSGGHFTGTNISSSYNSGTGVLTLTGADTLAHYQTVLNAVQFSSTSDNPTNYGA